MKSNSSDIELVNESSDAGTSLYRLEASDYKNSYYIISSNESRNLMMHPEVVGYEVYTSLLGASCKALKYLKKQDKISSVSILNILRGALNFPMEEACNLNDIAVHDISFLSCERTFDNKGDVNGLAVKYEKLGTVPNATLLIGDILASGDTLAECLKHVIDQYKKVGKELRNIILFTIGGTKALSLLEKLTKEIQSYWPKFEGFITVFYEGVFSCYEPGDKGVSGINRALIDFIWRDGIVSPEFREQALASRGPVFEKCIIYDGGARRFEIKEHVDEVLEFWNGILDRADKIDMNELLEEKLGHEIPISYEDWVKSCHYTKLDKEITQNIYMQECAFIETTNCIPLKQIAQDRIQEFTSAMKLYLL